MVTTRRKSARFQNENDSESFGNLMAVDSVQEQFQASQQEKQSKKKRRSSEGGKKKRKSEAAVALVEENPIPIEILVYEQIDEELLKLIRQIYYSPRYECDDLEYRYLSFLGSLIQLIRI